ncbi:hypothetical protein BDY21DRAFT_337225 [Lineolata rhizophorae]|uniref:Uncharacterized protein n=1 Tax=Lineolata rhizophorae TaxID=578093 RepID=A0A6A6P7U4_9PEZI|nr:hypothetical protein BDY21DRAFT_337225 [Lineolata rhizophorae]
MARTWRVIWRSREPSVLKSGAAPEQVRSMRPWSREQKFADGNGWKQRGQTGEWCGLRRCCSVAAAAVVVAVEEQPGRESVCDGTRLRREERKDLAAGEGASICTLVGCVTSGDDVGQSSGRAGMSRGVTFSRISMRPVLAMFSSIPATE